MNTAPSTPVDSSRYVKLKRSVQLAIHALFDAAPFASFIASFPLEIQVKHPDVLAYHYDVFRKSIEANVMQEFEVLMSNNQDPQKRFKFLDYLVTLEDGTLIAPQPNLQADSKAYQLTQQTYESKKKLKLELVQLLHNIEQDNERLAQENQQLQEQLDEASDLIANRTTDLTALSKTLSLWDEPDIADTISACTNYPDHDM